MLKQEAMAALLPQHRPTLAQFVYVRTTLNTPQYTR